ncbi:MAG: Flp pilus assembly protein CpaB [Gammaproteobacteria bacterium]|nr:Flp pilus assembly protein CpaB [Gammaproteobacteria bacterium]
MSGNNKKTLGLLIIALILGVVGAGLATLYLNSREAELRDLLTPKHKMVAVVVAKRDLVKGDILGTNTLAVLEIPSKYLDNNAVRPNQFESIDGQVLTQNLNSGKPLLNSYIGREFPLDFSDTIPKKRRAITIQVDEINSIAGLIRPGNRIDLFVNLPPGSDTTGKQKSNEVVPVLENLEVLATGKDAARDYEEKVRLLRGGIGVRPNQSYTTLTLNVTPKEGALITIAQDKGDLMALLRNREDTSGSGFIKVSTDSVRSHAQAMATQAAARASTNNINGNLVVGADGVIRTKDGKVLANQDLIIGEDGTIMTKDGTVISDLGLTINDKGQLVDANGNVIDPNKIKVAADGTVITEDGVVLGRPKTLQAGKLTTLADGTVITENGIVISGAKLNKDGMLVLADGTIVDPNDIVIKADGTIITKDGKLIAGLSAENVGLPGADGGPAGSGYEVEYIVGGVSIDSVATVKKVPLLE